MVDGSAKERAHAGPAGPHDGAWLDELRQLVENRAQKTTGERRAPKASSGRARVSSALLERPALRPSTSPRPSPVAKPSPRRVAEPAPKPSTKPRSSAPSQFPSPPPSTPPPSTPPRNFPLPQPNNAVLPKPVTSPCPRPAPARGADQASGDSNGENGGYSDAPSQPVSKPTPRSSFSGTARGTATVGSSRPRVSSNDQFGGELFSAPPEAGKNTSIGRARIPVASNQLSSAVATGLSQSRYSGEEQEPPRHRDDQPATKNPRVVNRSRLQKEPLLRRVVRTSGELLITLGLVVLLFAGYEVYGKTWEINAEQGRLTQALDAKWDHGGGNAAAAVHDEPIPGEGIARLHIPALSKNWVVVQGVSLEDIKRAPGHYPSSQMPDQLGNFAIAGHRTPAIFWDVDKLTKGDLLVLETRTAWFVYKIYQSQIVLPTKVSVVSANPDHPGTRATRKILTLTTCNPKWDNYQRLIIHAEQVRVQDKSQGRPTELGS